MATPVTPNLPTSADLDAVAAEVKAVEATNTPAAIPDVEEQKPASHDAAPPSLPNTSSHIQGVKGGPLNPSLDSDKFDSLGEPKEGGPVGPRGATLPLDVMTDADRQAVTDKQEARLKAGMSSTDHVDSRGNPQGAFKITPMGNNAMGARIPDHVDDSVLVEPNPPQVGPRGAGAPQDTFHGSRPPKK